MADRLEIKTDSVGQLKLFRSTTFIDPYAFITEAVQNAQRAGAKNLIIETGETYVRFTDDGVGLDDPEDLFTIAKTGWDSATIEDQRPFGIGFFACMAMADKVLVESHGRSYQFSYRDIIESGDTSVVVGESTFTDGFCVTLKEMVSEFDKWAFRDRVSSVCRFILGVDCFLNGKQIAREEYLNPPMDVLTVPVRFGQTNGWITLCSYSWNTELHIYHEDRYVCDLKLDGIRGCLSVGLDDLDLRAPDRRAFVENDRYRAFRDSVILSVKRLAIKFLEQDKVDTYNQDIISKYLNTEEYASRLQYALIADLGTLDRLRKAGSYELQHLTRARFEELMDKVDEPEVVEGPVELTSSVVHTFPASTDHDYVSPAPDFSRPDAESKIKKAPRAFKTLKGLAKKQVLYYAEPKDLEGHSDLLSQAINLNLPVALARTKLEAAGLKDILKATYIGDLAVEESTVISIVETKVSLKARRVYRLLKYLLTRLELDSSVEVRMGKIEAKKVYQIGNICIREEQIDRPILAEDGIIYLDVPHVNKSNILNMSDNRVDIGDLFYLLRNSEDLMKALSTVETKSRISYPVLLSLITELDVDWIITNRVADGVPDGD